MGKSLLLAAWAQRARAAGTTVFMGHCDELARDLPLQPVLDALDDHLRAAGAVSGSAEELLGADAELLAPLLSWTAQARPATPALSVLREQGTGQALLFGALVDVFSRFGQPAAVILDDVHLAGPATLEWLQLAARRAARRPLLLIAAQRREEAVPLPAATRIDLAPFDLAAAVAVVGEERAADLLERSHGNPLFLVELAAHLDAASLDASPPETIRAAVSARCDRAGPAAATLRLAAVLGSDVDLDLLVTILRGRPVEVLDHLEEGVRRGFLVERGNAFSFRHELIRTALEAGASASRRALAHREAARALAARPQGDPLTVAYHGRMGGDDNLTASALVDAAGLASARFDQEEALRLLARSLDLRDSLPARLLRAKVGIMVGDYEGALADVEAAVDQGGGARALELGAWAAHYQRDFTAAARLADEGANVATSPAEKAGCLTIGGWVRQCAGDLPGAEARLVAATDCAPASWRAVSGLWLGGLRVHQGRTTEGVALIRPAIVKDAVAAQAHPLAHANLFAALGLAQLGRAEEALAAAKELDRPDAPARWAGRAANVRGWILRNLGESAAADESNSVGLAEATAAGMVEAMSHAHLDLGAGLLAAGDLDGATARVDASLALGDSHALAWRHRMRARLYQGEIALGQGDAGAAIASAQMIQREATRSTLTSSRRRWTVWMRWPGWRRGG
jgi:tetratricopeptide (TPR) repeat protein